MHLFLIVQLSTLVLFYPTFLAFAIPLAKASNSTFTPAINQSTSVNSFDFDRNVALGIAAAQRAYPRVVPRLFLVAGYNDKPHRVPFIPSTIELQLYITYPKIIMMVSQASSSIWAAPVEKEDSYLDAEPFDWDRLPMSVMDAQLRLLTAENIPRNRRIFNDVAILMQIHDHPTLPIKAGELTFLFIRRNGAAGYSYIVFVVASSGEVFLDDHELATGGVQTT